MRVKGRKDMGYDQIFEVAVEAGAEEVKGLPVEDGEAAEIEVSDKSGYTSNCLSSR